MALLSSEQIDEIWADVNFQITCGCFDGEMTKAELRQAIVDIDQWCSDNKSTLMAICSTAVQDSMTEAARKRLVAKVAMARGLAGVT